MTLGQSYFSKSNNFNAQAPGSGFLTSFRNPLLKTRGISEGLCPVSWLCSKSNAHLLAKTAIHTHNCWNASRQAEEPWQRQGNQRTWVRKVRSKVNIVQNAQNSPERQLLTFSSKTHTSQCQVPCNTLRPHQNYSYRKMQSKIHTNKQTWQCHDNLHLGTDVNREEGICVL